MVQIGKNCSLKVSRFVSVPLHEVSQKPKVSLFAISDITETTFRISASIDPLPNAAVVLQYGKTEALGSEINIGNVAGMTLLNQVVTPDPAILQPGDQFYCRLKVTNAVGDTFSTVLNGGLLNVLPTPYFALPENGVTLLVGQEVTIYGDSLVNIPIDNNLTVEYTCDIGTQSGRNFVVNPVAEGVYTLTMVFKESGRTFETKTINLKCVTVAPSGTKKIFMTGASILTHGSAYYASQINAIIPLGTFSYIGTQGETIKHEGHPGYTFADYVLNNRPETNPSPYFKAGVLNIPAYFADNSLATPDYFFILCGNNDTFGYSSGVIEFTDAIIDGILNNAKTLIDGFLAFNANAKIILSIPPICCDSVEGWNAAYDETKYFQDLYIENMHKFWIRFINQFANGNYHANVTCSYSPIFLDRNEGYPKVAGVHTNALHPDESGYLQLGSEIAASINNLLLADLNPTNVTAVWENDYAKIDFTDSTGGTYQHEIWESKNGGAYSLVTTLDAGVTTYNNPTWQNANMNFKVRAKSGIKYSNYSSIVNLVTPLTIKTNQDVLADAILAALYVTAGKTVNVDWGDGNNQNVTGNTTNITHTYSATANPYYIKVTGDVNFITRINFSAKTNLYGSTAKWVLPTSLTYLTLAGSSFAMDVSNWVLPTGLTYISLAETLNVVGVGFTGNPSNWVIPNNITNILLTGTANGNKLEGDLSGWNLPATCLQFTATNQNFTKLPRGQFVGLDATRGITASGCNCNTQEIDDFLVYANNYFAGVTPVKNLLFALNADGMGIPSAVGLAARQGIIDKFTAAGFTATITVNS